MENNYFNRSRGACGHGTDHRMLPEAELWTQVILQAINDLREVHHLPQGRPKILPENGLPRNRMRYAASSGLVRSSM